jgi:hypothetical protein
MEANKKTGKKNTHTDRINTERERKERKHRTLREKDKGKERMRKFVIQ